MMDPGTGQPGQKPETVQASGSFTLKELLLIGAVGLLTLILYFTSGKETLLAYWILIVAAHDIDLEDIVRVGLAVHTIMMALIIGGCIVGVLENRVYLLWQDNAFRYREGIGFQFIYSSFYLFLITLELIYIKRDTLTLRDALEISVFAYLIYTRTDTFNYFFFTEGTLAAALLLRFIPALRRYNPLYAVLSVLTPIAAAGVSVWAAIRYDSANPRFASANAFLHERLEMGHRGFENFRITLFGQRIEWFDDAQRYNVIDSSYVQSIFIFGVILCAVVLVAMVLLGICISLQKDTWYLLVFGILTVHCMIEPELLILPMNTFLLSYSYIQTALRQAFRPIGSKQK